MRASCQMKNEMPPSSIRAPIAMATMLPPPRLPLVEVEVVGSTVGVVGAGVWIGALGRPGLNGFVATVL